MPENGLLRIVLRRDISPPMRLLNTAFLIVVVAVGICSQGFAAADFELSKTILTPFYQGDAFLSKIGFKNYSSMADDTLASDVELHPVAEIVLENNVQFYTSLKGAKYLGDLSYAFLTLNEKVEPAQKNHNIQILLNIATQQVQAFPLIGLEPVTDSKFKSLQGKAAMDLREDILGTRAIARYQQEKENLIKSYSYLYLQLETGPKKSVAGFQTWIDARLREALWDSYTLSSAQQNRHFGRAMVAVLVKYSREKNLNIESLLRQKLQTVGINLDDIITAKYRPITDRKDEPALQLRSGDLALEFSSGQGAFFTAMSVEPTTPENQALAKKYDLIASYNYIPTFLAQNYYDEALDKGSSNVPLNLIEKKLLKDYWDPQISKGYSHVGLVEVKTDEASRISLAWIWDSFPHHQTGGVRYMSPEGFAYPEQNVRIGFARYNPAKVLATFQKQLQTRGYLETVFESPESFVTTDADKKDVAVLDRTKRYKWPAHITRAQALALAKDTAPAQAEVWYQQRLLPLVFQRMEELVYTPDAVGFSPAMVTAHSLTYCSQLIRLAFLQATNFDPAPLADRYREIPSYLTTRFPKLTVLDNSGTLLAPAGLVWQADILESHIQYNFSRERVQRQKQLPSVADVYTNLLSYDPIVNFVQLVIEPSKMNISDSFIADDASF